MFSKCSKYKFSKTNLSVGFSETCKLLERSLNIRIRCRAQQLTRGACVTIKGRYKGKTGLPNFQFNIVKARGQLILFAVLYATPVL